jgi:hypothetical protein
MTQRTSKLKIKAVFLLIFFTSGVAAFLSQLRGQEQNETERSWKTEVDYGAENFRDPFKSPIQSEMLIQPGDTDPNTPEVQLPNLKVQGVFWGASFPQAIINDKVVKAGDTVDAVTIVSIEKDFIMVSFVNRKYKLSSPVSENSFNSSNKQAKMEDNHEN